MPLCGVICGYDGKYRSFEDCIQCHEQGGRNCHAPVQLLKIMRDNHLTRKDAGWSASTLTSCARWVALTEQYDYYEDLKSGYNKARGTWVHAMIESDDTPREGLVRERRIARTFIIDGKSVQLTGKPDEIDTIRRTLIDYKSKDRVPTKPDPRHEAQFNIYVGLIRDGIFLDKEGGTISLEIESGGMHYLTWNPKEPFKKMGYPVWSEEMLQAFMEDRLRPLIEWRDEGIMPACNAYTTFPGKWRCDCVKLLDQLRERGVEVEPHL